jgi:hypothetical protein
MRKFSNNSNVDNSDLSNYPDARIKDNTGALDGTPVNERVYGDVIQFFLKLKRLAGITANDLPDNETNGFQTIQSLKEFATKNNYIQNISSVSGVLNVSAKIGLMQNDEFLVCKSSIDLGAETQIKGTDGVINTITTIGTFKTNEYVRLIKTASTIFLVRISDAASLDLMVSELLYLKKATQSEENAGTIETKATTPKTNLTAFIRRVIGADSATYLAKPTGDPNERNGLLSKEDKSIIDGITNRVINKGWFSGINISTTTGSLPIDGDLSSAVASIAGNNTTFVLVTMANTMANTNYKVVFDVESQGTLVIDTDCMAPIFRKISTTQFTCAVSEVFGSGQNLKIHFEVIQL